MEIRPAQVTLVPDAEDVLTSNAGWDTKCIWLICRRSEQFNDAGIRTSIFIDPVVEMIQYAETGCHRVELYTEVCASGYAGGREQAVEPYKSS